MSEPNIPVLYAFICTDEGEGIVSQVMRGITFPLVTGNEKLVGVMRDGAREISKACGRRIELRKYMAYEVVEKIAP